MNILNVIKYKSLKNTKIISMCQNSLTKNLIEIESIENNGFSEGSFQYLIDTFF